MVTVVPTTVQTSVVSETNETVRPESAVATAVSVNSLPSNVWSAIAGKSICWPVLVDTWNDCWTGVAAA